MLRLLSLTVFLLLIGGWVVFFSGGKSSAQSGQRTFAHEQQGEVRGQTLGNQEGCRAESIPVLMYHHVRQCPEGSVCGTKGSIEYGLSIDPALFERQMKTLKDQGYASVLPRALVEGKVPCRSFVLTFDDGYSDNITYALPVLQQYGFRAGFAIIVDRVDTPGYMGAADIVKLIDGGNEILSHTVSHPNLPSLPDGRLRGELELSRTALESAFNVPVQGLVYPSGRYDAHTEKVAREVGYSSAFTTQGGWAVVGKGMFAIMRMRMSNSINTTLSEVLK